MGWGGTKCQPGNPGERPLEQNLENESSEKILVIPESKLKEELNKLHQDLLNSSTFTNQNQNNL